MTRRGALLAALAAILGTAALGCGGDPAGRPTETIRLATTTSARDTGLLDLLLPAFRKESGIEVQPIAVGTGEALKYGERGDADVVLVHSRKAEDAFVAKGFGVERKDVWWNRFQVVGPPRNPARPQKWFLAYDTLNEIAYDRSKPIHDHVALRTRPDAAAFLRCLRKYDGVFVSRGDDSGTHKREMDLWKDDFGPWPGYVETGQGMGPTLTIADEKSAYTLTDEGTYLRMRKNLLLEPAVVGDPVLRNPYGVILVKPPAPGSARSGAARHFYEWLTSESCRAIVKSLVIDKERAFYLPEETAPDALLKGLDKLLSPPR